MAAAQVLASSVRYIRHRPELTATWFAILTYLAATLLGVCLALYIFPIHFLFPRGTDGPFATDFAQHVIGQRYFIADAWRWPLLDIPILNRPDGANVGFTDSIPLLALVLKLLAPLLPAGFQGIGLWYGICWIAQPIAAVWCVRASGETRVVPALCMAVVAVSIPAWLNRFVHVALSSHFLLLFGLGTYFILVRRGGALRWAAAAGLLCITLLVHPYLFVMNAAIVFAAPLTLLVRNDKAWHASLGYAAGTLLVMMVVLRTLGYLDVTGEGGYGAYAMNLLSPVWPAGSWWLAAMLKPIPMPSAGTWGWEGYNYLGLGIIVGLLVILMIPRAAWAIVSSHSGIVIVLFGLTMLALSNQIAIGHLHFENVYPAPATLEQFRSSGRFFWPVTYALALYVVLTIGRLRSQRSSLLLLTLVGGLQFTDAAALRNDLASRLSAPSPPWSVDASALRPILESHRFLVVLPRFDCIPRLPDLHIQPSMKMEMDILTLASETAIPTNTMYLARWHTRRSCDDAASAQAQLRPGEVRVLLPGVQDALLPLVPGEENICRRVGLLAVCTSD
ncbi:MAG: DUF6311 domain-containing protein [Acetobacteraceae bacterium]|nr:DUF6311 domain-containing protein [Acetobacteraceae bacterium]